MATSIAKLNIEIPESIETERLQFRVPQVTDAPTVLQSVTESFKDLVHTVPWLESMPTLDQVKGMLQAAFSECQKRSCLPYLMFAKSDGRHVGMAELRSLDWNVPSFEIGLWCHSDLRGQGYGSEAITLLSKLAFSLGAARVQALTSKENIRASKCFERLGFQYEGTLRAHIRTASDGQLHDSCIYSMISAEELVSLDHV